MEQILPEVNYEPDMNLSLDVHKSKTRIKTAVYND